MKACIVDGCDRRRAAYGYCSTHYYRLRTRGFVDDTPVGTLEHHGGTKSVEYNTWAQMKARCYNSKSHNYINYGARGITVCDRWKNSFGAFLKDMGPRPSPKHSIDRINNNGNYEPNNCRWATNSEQVRNQRNTRLNIDVAREIRALAKTQTRTAIARRYRLNVATVCQIVLGKIWKEIL